MKRFSISLLSLMILFPCCNKNKIKIDFGIFNSNDFEIYLSAGIPIRLNENPTIIYKEGVYYHIPNEYGENDWVITYKGQQKCEFRHFKTNWRYTHKYYFGFYEKQDTLYCDVDIRGKNKEKETLIFHSMSDTKTTYEPK